MEDEGHEPEEKAKASVKIAVATLAATLCRGYAGPSNGNPRRKKGPMIAAPPIPAVWAHVATKIPTGNMKAYRVHSGLAASDPTGSAKSCDMATGICSPPAVYGEGR